MGWVLNKRSEEWRGASLVLALLALLVNGLVPPGYMAGPVGRGPALVICSGHGPASIGWDGRLKPLKAPKSRPDAPCAFAGHGIAANPTLASSITIQTSVIAPPAADVWTDLTPGQGLAAPPSQAPPLSL